MGGLGRTAVQTAHAVGGDHYYATEDPPNVRCGNTGPRSGVLVAPEARPYSVPTPASSFAVASGASIGKLWLPRSTGTMLRRFP